MPNGQSYYQMTAGAPSPWDEILPGLQRGMEQARQRRKDVMQEATLKLQRDRLTELLKEAKEEREMRKQYQTGIAGLQRPTETPTGFAPYRAAGETIGALPGMGAVGIMARQIPETYKGGAPTREQMLQRMLTEVAPYAGKMDITKFLPEKQEPYEPKTREDILAFEEEKARRTRAPIKLTTRYFSYERGQYSFDPTTREVTEIMPPTTGKTYQFRTVGNKISVLDPATGKEVRRISVPMAAKVPAGKAPSWGQEQKVSSVKANLKRGRGALVTQWGEPQEFEIDNLPKALDYISKQNLSPELFVEELKQYQPIMVRNSRGETGTIPMRELNKALAQGYTRVVKPILRNSK